MGGSTVLCHHFFILNIYDYDKNFCSQTAKIIDGFAISVLQSVRLLTLINEGAGTGNPISHIPILFTPNLPYLNFFTPNLPYPTFFYPLYPISQLPISHIPTFFTPNFPCPTFFYPIFQLVCHPPHLCYV